MRVIISLCSKKGICFGVISLLITAFVLMSRAMPVVAESWHRATTSPQQLQVNGQRAIISPQQLRVSRGQPLIRQHSGPGGPLPWHNQQNNQLVQGGFEQRNFTFVGHDQGNDGNQGVNKGNNQDNSTNRGNLFTNQHRNIQFQLNNQHIQAGSNGLGSNHNTFIGANQGNSGNSGVNLGNNQDNSSNSGNQVNNQGSVIGTQVNAQGTQGAQVNNDGSVIHQQVNHIDHVYLLPPLHLTVQLLSRPLLGIGSGG